jgi:hypothetical protein
MGAFERMTMLSWVAAVAGNAACSSSVALAPEEVTKIAADYRATGTARVPARDRLLIIRSEHEPTLTVLTNTCRLDEGQTEEDCEYSVTAPLDQVRPSNGEALVLRERVFQPNEIQAELSFRGSPNSVPYNPPKAPGLDVERDRTAAPPAVDTLSWRHEVGLQLGGTAYAQIAYRYRFWGPLHIEIGALGSHHVMNGSAGLLIKVALDSRWAVYAGSGGGFGWGGGPATDKSCDANTTDCPLTTSFGGTYFVHVRAGLALKLDASRRHAISIDGGFWTGTEWERGGGQPSYSRPIFWPMAGCAYHHAF